MNDMPALPGFNPQMFTYVFVFQQIVAFVRTLILACTLLSYCRSWITHSVSIPVEHQIARDVLEYMASNTSGSAKRHTKLGMGRRTFNNVTEQFDSKVLKQTAIEAVWFMFESRPLYFESIELPVQHQHATKALPHLSHLYKTKQSGHIIRISTLRCFQGEILASFLSFIRQQKVIAENKTAVATVETDQGSRYSDGCWEHRTRSSRPLSTIDLDLEIKEDLVKDFERFVIPGRAKWYLDRGVPYYRGFLFHGPPGTGKSSTAFALASHLKKVL